MMRARASNISRILRARARIDVPGGDTGSGSCDSICCRAPRCVSQQLLLELEGMREEMGSATAQDLYHARSLVTSVSDLARYVRSQGSLCPPLAQEFSRLRAAAASADT